MERALARGRWAIVVALLGVWLVLAPWARAAPTFSPPSGWGEGAAADAQARLRADAWAKAWDAEVRRVMSTRADDGFAETLAILDVAAPIPAEALTDLEAGRTWLEPRVVAALGATATLDPDGLELRRRPEPGVAVLLARVRQDDRIVRIAVAPLGVRHLAVVLMLPQAEEVLYASVLDDTVDGLDGLQRPIAPLRRGLLRTVALLSWLLVGGVFAFEWTRRALPRPGARVAGRQVAAALVATSLLVLVLAGSFLGDAAVELALADSTPWAFALELSLGGVVMAALVVVATELWERRLRPIASAPESGTFAMTKTGPRRAVSSLSIPIAPSARPAVTGDTHVGPPPAVTGNTHVGPPPAVTGNTKVGPPPAVTGDTHVGPAPRPVVTTDGGPPVREIISGDIEVQTQVRRIPEPDTVKTAAPLPDTVKTFAPSPPALDLTADEDTNPRGVPGTHDGPAPLADPVDRPRGVPPRPPPRAGLERRPAADDAQPAREPSLPKLEIDWS
jgi:hypothetical protein